MNLPKSAADATPNKKQISKENKILIVIGDIKHELEIDEALKVAGQIVIAVERELKNEV